MADIIDFESLKRIEGYDYFAMEVLYSLLDEEEGAQDFLVQVEDMKGHFHGICGAELDRDNHTVILKLED